MNITKELRDAKRDLIRKLQNLAKNSMEREEQATLAIDACRLFQEKLDLCPNRRRVPFDG